MEIKELDENPGQTPEGAGKEDIKPALIDSRAPGFCPSIG